MEHSFRFAYPLFLYAAVPIFCVAVFLRWWWYKPVTYKYSLSSTLQQAGKSAKYPYHKLLWLLRFTALSLLVFLLGKPQLVDVSSNSNVEGIDIMLVLDISGSMRERDHDDDKRSRLEIAKDEALRFVDKRESDAIGVVLFAADVISRCPLTLDKKILKDLVKEINLGYLNPDGTLLATGIILAANRLKTSQSKSKVMIVLTDGEPSQGDKNPKIAIEVAKQLGIKIYTVGIGSAEDRYMMHPFYGKVPLPGVNKKLLNTIAQQTGGQFFLARNAQDMRDIYDTIDKLERVELEAPIFTRYYELLFPYIWIVLLLLLLEIVLASLIWFGL